MRLKATNMSLEADLASKDSLAKEEICDLKAKLADADEKNIKLEKTFKEKKETYLSMQKECMTYRQLLEVEEARYVFLYIYSEWQSFQPQHHSFPDPPKASSTGYSARRLQHASPEEKQECWEHPPGNFLRRFQTNLCFQEVDVSEIGATENARPDASCFIMWSGCTRFYFYLITLLYIAPLRHTITNPLPYHPVKPKLTKHAYNLCL